MAAYRHEGFWQVHGHPARQLPRQPLGSGRACTLEGEQHEPVLAGSTDAGHGSDGAGGAPGPSAGCWKPGPRSSAWSATGCPTRNWSPADCWLRSVWSAATSAIRHCSNAPWVNTRLIPSFISPLRPWSPSPTVTPSPPSRPTSPAPGRCSSPAVAVPRCGRSSSPPRTRLTAPPPRCPTTRIPPCAASTRMMSASRAPISSPRSSYAATYDLPVAVTRCGNFYGGGDLNWNRIVPGTIRSVPRGLRCPLIRSDGQYIRDYFYVEDMAPPPICSWPKSSPRTPGCVVRHSTSRRKRAAHGPGTGACILAVMDSAIAAGRAQPVARNEIRNQSPAAAARVREALGWSPLFHPGRGTATDGRLVSGPSSPPTGGRTSLAEGGVNTSTTRCRSCQRCGAGGDPLVGPDPWPTPCSIPTWWTANRLTRSTWPSVRTVAWCADPGDGIAGNAVPRVPVFLLVCGHRCSATVETLTAELDRLAGSTAANLVMEAASNDGYLLRCYRSAPVSEWFRHRAGLQHRRRGREPGTASKPSPSSSPSTWSAEFLRENDMAR